jgi:hypothetical protein
LIAGCVAIAGAGFLGLISLSALVGCASDEPVGARKTTTTTTVDTPSVKRTTTETTTKVTVPKN